MPRRRHARAVLATCLFVGCAALVPGARQAQTRGPGERADIIVAQDGSGDFRTIQPALDAIPKDNQAHRIILIRNGVYREKLFITAGIWHDGSKDRDQKLVIRRSRFDGVKDFPLGRNNRDGQFFLLDCAFSSSMADRPIYRPSAPETYLSPARYYYWNDHREGGDYPWFADNLASADTSPHPRAITAAWTFAGRWDPEATLPAVLPFASIPRPRDEGQDISLLNTRLRWTAGRNALSHDVYFGTSNPPRFRRNQAGTTFDPGPLETATTYFWRIDTVTPAGLVQGPVWTFMTAATVRFVLVGDSTVTDDSGWGRGFAARLTSRSTIVNLARNGRSSKSYIDEGHWRAAAAQGADVILIQFGHNDMPGKGPERETDPATTYRARLARYVDEARAAGATPVLVTSLTRRLFTDAGTIASDLGPYADAVKAVAAEKDAPAVDLHAASIALLNRLGPKSGGAFGVLKDDGTLDRTHLSPEGSAVFGAIVANELRKTLPALAPYINPPAGDPDRAPARRTATPSAAPVLWSRCLDQPPSWYASGEAVRIADLVLAYQRETGGWPKNIDMARPLDAGERAEVKAARNETDSTIDNGATTTRGAADLGAVLRDRHQSPDVLRPRQRDPLRHGRDRARATGQLQLVRPLGRGAPRSRVPGLEAAAPEVDPRPGIRAGAGDSGYGPWLTVTERRRGVCIYRLMVSLRVVPLMRTFVSDSPVTPSTTSSFATLSKVQSATRMFRMGVCA